MGLFGQSTQEGVLLPEHKFDYINLNDFRSPGALAGFAYFTIFLGMLVSLGAHAADIYTAVNLLVFNRWSSSLDPVLDFRISKWIFAGCIILSFAILVIEWAIAIKAIRGNGVADIYLNRIAQRWCCLFGGRGRKEDTGWKRFLVFARLTKSKKGVDYVALFTHFSFQGWLRIVFAEGPRQVINTLTLIAVFEANLIPKDVHKGAELSAIVTFFKNYKILADQDRVQALILGSMAFTLIVWVFSMLQLFVAGILYLFFLCHIMSGNIGLGGYCKERVDERLAKIVATNHHKALARAETKLTAAEGPAKPIERQPTIPLGFGGPGLEKGIPVPTRANTVASQSSSLASSRVPTLPNIDSLEKAVAQNGPRGAQPHPRPFGIARTMTESSATSTTGLLSASGEIGYGGRGLDRTSTPSSTNSMVYRGNNGYAEAGYAPPTGRPSPAPSRNHMRPPPQSRSPQYFDGSASIAPYQQQQYPGRPPAQTTPASNYGSDYSEHSSNFSHYQYGPSPSLHRHPTAASSPGGYRPEHPPEYPNRAATAPPPRDNMRSPPNFAPSAFSRPPLTRAFTDDLDESDTSRSELGGSEVSVDTVIGESYEMTPQGTGSALFQTSNIRAGSSVNSDHGSLAQPSEETSSTAGYAVSRNVSSASSVPAASVRSGEGGAQGRKYLAYKPGNGTVGGNGGHVRNPSPPRETRITPPLPRSQTVAPYEFLRNDPVTMRSATAPPSQVQQATAQRGPTQQQQRQGSNRESYDPYGEQYSKNRGLGSRNEG